MKKDYKQSIESEKQRFIEQEEGQRQKYTSIMEEEIQKKDNLLTKKEEKIRQEENLKMQKELRKLSIQKNE